MLHTYKYYVSINSHSKPGRLLSSLAGRLMEMSNTSEWIRKADFQTQICLGSHKCSFYHIESSIIFSVIKYFFPRNLNNSSYEDG